MRFLVIVKASPESEAGEMPSEALLTAMGAYNEELVKAGVMLAGEGLHPSSKGVRVQFSGKNRTVVDGPFAETKELIAGFWIFKVQSQQEAIDWVKRCPNPMISDSEIEIRQIFEMEDFGETFTSDLREQEARLRAQMSDQSENLTPGGPTMRVIPYLTFNGNCKEAFALYKDVLGGEQFSMTFAEAPEETGMPKDNDLILHTCLTVGDFSLMASDCPPGQPYRKPQGVSVSLNVDSVAEAERLFNGLSAGGSVHMPLAKTFWAERFAMFEDRFGIAWMVNCEGAK